MPNHKSYCPDVWNGFTIVKNGDVYHCCHLRPNKLGNIYQEKLEDIANNSASADVRRRSLIGELDCYRDCNMVDRSIDTPTRPSNGCVEYSDFKRIHISFGEDCNIRCIMCDHPFNHQKNPLYLDEKKLIENVDIEPFVDILLQGGEPLHIPQCLNYMEYLESRNKKYMILTNGTLIDERMAMRLAFHSKLVSISINGASKEVHESVNLGSNYHTVLEGIRLMNECRSKIGSKLSINGRMTLTIQNVHEIPDFLEGYQNLGFDTINFGYDKETVPQYLANNPKLFKGLKLKIERILSDRDLAGIDARRLRTLGLYDGQTIR